jgi:DNA-binding beta-propeller fold protein YncE
MGAAVMAIAVGGLGHHFGGHAHIRKKLGQEPLADVSCFNCHFVSTERLPWAKPHPRHDAPAGLAISPDGKRLYIALDDRDQIAEADAVSMQVLRRMSVAGGPVGLAMDPEGTRLFVACKKGDRVAVLDLPGLNEIGSAAAGMGPVAVAFCRTEKGDRLITANSMSDDVSTFSVWPLAELSRVSAGREPMAICVTKDGGLAFVANRLVNLESVKGAPSSEITVLDPATGRIVRRDDLESAHLSEGVAIAGSRDVVLTPLVKVRNLVPITQVANGWVMSSGVAVSDVKTGELTQMPLDEANEYYADPSGIVINTAGTRAFIVSGGSDTVTVVDLEKMGLWLSGATDAEKKEAIYDLALSSEYVIGRIPTRRNPRQALLSADGRKLFVAERLEDSVLIVDAETLKSLGRIMLGDGGLNDPIRRGERVFTTAAYTFQHQFSCRSCHPDGHVDGLSYDFDGDGIGDNLLDNRSLQGVAGTGPFKWNGKNASLEMQCGPRFARVLMRTDPFPADKLRDLTTFIQSLPPARVVRHAAGKFTPAQERGRAIFYATRTPEGTEIPVSKRCVTCHPPPLYTVRLPFDVGTKGPYDSSGFFDAPHLLGIAGSAPYLHDGRGQTLEELWTLYNTNDMHGVSSYMNKIQLNDLVEFLKTL